MRPWMLALLVFAIVLWIDSARAAGQAKPNPAVSEWVETADGMKLNAQFTATTTPKKGETAATSPVVVLLYSPGIGQDMNKGSWSDLIGLLNADGFNVFQFDWRGHGKSTDIVTPKEFWLNKQASPWNTKYIKGFDKKAVLAKTVLKVDDVGPKYFPMYVQDLAAVRTHLDQKNDKNVVNTSSIYVIGAEDTVQLGLLWLTTEWNRPGVHPMLGGGRTYDVVPSPKIKNKPEGGKDIAGMIWLSPKQPVGGPITQPTLKEWIKNTPSIQESNPMLFLHGDMDQPGKTAASYYMNQVLIQGAKPPLPVALQLTFVRDVKNTKLQGVGLLGLNGQLKTEDIILDYLRAQEKARGTPAAKNRNFVTPYVVDLTAFNVNP